MRLACPIEGCPNDRPTSHAMCPGHWRQVPADLKRAVIRAWRERTGPNAGREAVQRHLQALEDAEAAVEGREPRHLFGETT